MSSFGEDLKSAISINTSSDTWHDNPPNPGDILNVVKNEERQKIVANRVNEKKLEAHQLKRKLALRTSLVLVQETQVRLKILTLSSEQTYKGLTKRSSNLF